MWAFKRRSHSVAPTGCARRSSAWKLREPGETWSSLACFRRPPFRGLCNVHLDVVMVFALAPETGQAEASGFGERPTCGELGIARLHDKLFTQPYLILIFPATMTQPIRDAAFQGQVKNGRRFPPGWREKPCFGGGRWVVPGKGSSAPAAASGSASRAWISSITRRARQRDRARPGWAAISAL